MIFHLCSHWGDIEVVEHGEHESLINYFKLTPIEREALDKVLARYDLERSGAEGEIVVPKSVVLLGGEIGAHGLITSRSATSARCCHDATVPRGRSNNWAISSIDRPSQ